MGFIWNFVDLTVSVPPCKVEDLKCLCSSALSGPISLRFLAKIIGTVESFRFGCPIAPLHYRSLQFDLVDHLSPEPVWSSLIELSQSAIADLKWWLACDHSLRPSSLVPFSPTHRVETDASLVGWGVYSHSNLFTQGRWSYSESLLHINLLELSAISLGIRSLFRDSSHISILVLCDNVSAVRYINRMGGTKSRRLCSIALSLWDYCLSRGIWLKAVYHRGSDNVRADRL